MSETSQTKTENSAVNNGKPAESKDQSPLELALQNLASDGKLVSNLFKTLFSSVGTVLALCGAGYLYYKNQQAKKNSEKLQAENTTLKEQNDELLAKYIKAKRRKIEDIEEEQDGPVSGHRSRRFEKKNKQTFYLD